MSASQSLTTSLNLDVLSTETLRGTLAPLRSPALHAAQINASPQRSQGTLTVRNGQVTSQMITVAGTRTETTSIEQFSQNLAKTLAGVQGSISFDRGIAQTNLQSPLGNFTETIDFAGAIGTAVQNWLQTVSGDIPFQNGRFDVDMSTVLGALKGSIEFGNGALVTNLTTPFGFLFTSIDFKPEDQILFQLRNYPGTVNFDDGLVVVHTQPKQSIGDIAVPINALSGTLHLENGQGSVKIPTPIGAANAKFDFSALLSRSIVDSLQGSGTITVKNGVATINTGNVQTTLDLPAIVRSSEFRQALSAFAGTETSKTISFDPISFVTNLATLNGALAGRVDLTALRG